MLRRLRITVIYAVIAVSVAAAAIAVSLALTPTQKISAAGQSIEVGVTGPSLHLSGPGELDLFGQHLDTSIQFIGPIRPRIKLSRITLSKQLKNFAASDPHPEKSLAHELERGFRHFVYWQSVIVGLVAITLAGAVCGWMRRGLRQSLALIGAIVLFTEAINLGAIMVSAYTAPARLSHVHSLQALVGNVPDLKLPVKKSSHDAGGSTVVIGDSTAAGLGNPPMPHPTKQDRACHRSIDSYAEALAKTSGTFITNLACNGATIRAGLLGPQTIGSVSVPAQLSQPSATSATTIIVSIGANDVKWTDQLSICAVSVSCKNEVDRALFQQYLARFSTDYLQLLSELQSLPNRPQILINQYYDPFGDNIDCLAKYGVTKKKVEAMRSKLEALNEVLKSGAHTAAFKPAKPNFSNHGLCSSAPFVQSIKSEAPFHPTAAGELAIALIDDHVLRASN